MFVIPFTDISGVHYPSVQGEANRQSVMSQRDLFFSVPVRISEGSGRLWVQPVQSDNEDHQHRLYKDVSALENTPVFDESIHNDLSMLRELQFLSDKAYEAGLNIHSEILHSALFSLNIYLEDEPNFGYSLSDDDWKRIVSFVHHPANSQWLPDLHTLGQV